MLNAAGMLLVMLLLAALADPSAAWAQLPCHRPSLHGAPHPAVAERGRRVDGRLGPVALSSRGIDAQTGTTQVQESERDAAFLQWASQRGVVAPKLAIAEFPPGYRGMAATGPIPPGEALVSLPRTTCLLVGERQPSPFPGFAPAPFWNTQSLHVRLALVLLFQRRLAERGASSSQIRPWMDVLPASHADKPCRWSDAELAELCDPVLVEEIENQRQAIDAIHSQLLAVGGGRWDKVALRGGMSGKDPLQDPSETVTVSDFRWAMDTVISRTFGAQLPLVATPGVWQTALMVVLSGLGRAWPWLCRVGPTEWRRVMDATATSQEVLILEPVVDMLNHETRALSETRYDASADTITIASSDDAWQPGQQVMICYGSKTNRKLLTNYGFVEEDNPVDATLLPGGVARARAVLLTALCQPAAGTAAPGVAADGTDVEQVWRSRVQTLSRCDGLSDADKVLVTAAGPSSRAVAGLGLLLCDQDEFSAFAAAVAGLDEGACKSALMAASFGLDCQLRVYETVKGLCDDAIASASHPPPPSGGPASQSATAYRASRLRLLDNVVKQMQANGRLSVDLGVPVQQINADDWLERQQHALLRDLNNLGF